MSHFILVTILACFGNNGNTQERCLIYESKYVKASRIEEMRDEEALVCKDKHLTIFSYESATNCHRQKVCSVYGIDNGSIVLVTQSCASLAKAAK